MKVILFTTLLLFSVNGFAFNWKKVSQNKGGDTYYVDVDNLKKHYGFVYYWQLDDLLEPIKSVSDSINSAIIKYKVDCGEEKQTWLNENYYSQSMGRGRIVAESSPNKIDYPKPREVGYTVMKFACDNAR